MCRGNDERSIPSAREVPYDQANGSYLAMGAVAACASMQAGSAPKDGALALPADYKSWPVFVKDVQKPGNTSLFSSDVAALMQCLHSPDFFTIGSNRASIARFL